MLGGKFQVGGFHFLGEKMLDDCVIYEHENSSNYNSSYCESKHTTQTFKLRKCYALMFSTRTDMVIPSIFHTPNYGLKVS